MTVLEFDYFLLTIDNVKARDPVGSKKILFIVIEQNMIKLVLILFRDWWDFLRHFMLIGLIDSSARGKYHESDHQTSHIAFLFEIEII